MRHVGLRQAWKIEVLGCDLQSGQTIEGKRPNEIVLNEIVPVTDR